MDNEYIIFIKNEIYRVYAPNEMQAINRFKTACSKYKLTENEHYNKYWSDLINSIDTKNYTLLQNTDFHGVRKI